MATKNVKTLGRVRTVYSSPHPEREEKGRKDLKLGKPPALPVKSQKGQEFAVSCTALSAVRTGK